MNIVLHRILLFEPTLIERDISGSALGPDIFQVVAAAIFERDQMVELARLVGPRVILRMRDVVSVVGARLLMWGTLGVADGARAEALAANGVSDIVLGGVGIGLTWRKTRVGEDLQLPKLLDWRVRSNAAARQESLVDSLVNTRMNKRRQMRWSSQGAHRVLQVRAAVIDKRLHAGQIKVAA